MSNAVYPFQPVPFTQVSIQDSFWLPRIETNRQVTIPYDFQKCEETGRIDNFVKAAGKMEGSHKGLHFNDSDVYKIIEGAAYSLQVHPDPELEAYIDDVIEKIAAAQEPDGYIYTARTIDPDHPHKMSGPERWSRTDMSHELYNLGHMYEGAVAYFQATGKRAFLDVAIKSADLITTVFGPDALRNVPGHQEVELGLVKLYGVTGDTKYLNLAKFFLDERGQANGRELQQALGNIGYMQDHMPVVEQREAVGHSVRAMYMYSAMADVAALTGDQAYINAIRRIWENVVQRKMSLTGGLGARHHGEAFGDDYELPNLTAYNETCAAIGSIFWNYRLFLLDGEAKYYDILERTLYNGFLSGISLEGDTFFYVNPLESDGEFAFNSDNSITRQPWFGCSCCPTNVVRLMPSLPGYVYATHDDRLYVNLYMGSEAKLKLGSSELSITQDTRYPWTGDIKLTINPAHPVQFTLSLRVPGWVKGQPVPSDLYRYVDNMPDDITCRVNGNTITAKEAQGYLNITRIWQAGDTVELILPMRIQRVVAHPQVADCQGKVALERGPIVYAAEGIDNGGWARDLSVPDDMPLSTRFSADLLNGIVVIVGNEFTAIPYYAWAHRGLSEMAVWFLRK
ncbi:MAG TPA: glycoside hydrolase family 127 protein [Aggregatilineaceae bacterium]|nr:glycoside hydrolase family 127 protein [Aggregatilineaceae bacterium]